MVLALAMLGSLRGPNSLQANLWTLFDIIGIRKMVRNIGAGEGN